MAFLPVLDFYTKVFPDILFLIIDLGNLNSTLFNFFTARHSMSLSVAVSTNFVHVLYSRSITMTMINYKNT